MASSATSSKLDLINHDSVKQEFEITGPSNIIPRDAITSNSPSVYELDNLQWGKRLKGPDQPSRLNDALNSSLKTSDNADVEQLQHEDTGNLNAVNAIRYSASFPSKNPWRLVAAGLVYFYMGLNDGATGAIIPSIESQYHVSYGVVSLLFLTNAIGFISAAFVVQALDTRFGRSKTYIAAAMSSTVGFAALTSAPPYPVVVLSFLFTGFGFGVFLGMTNAFICDLQNGTTLLGFMHGLYGVGGTLSPLMATAIINNSGSENWSHFYALPLSLAATAIVSLGWSFHGFENDMVINPDTALHMTISRQTNATVKINMLWASLKNRTTILGALYILFYQGAEVAISGWIITFLITHRNGDPGSVGNVTSGFWAGITLGRFVLTPLATHTFNLAITLPRFLASSRVATEGHSSSRVELRVRIPHRPFVFVLVVSSAVFQLLVWLLPSVVGPAVSQSIVGLFLGPLYPLATSTFARLLPRKIQISALSFVGAMGSSGGAIVPLITGLLAQGLQNGIGTAVLHPVVLGSLAVMALAWITLPRDPEKAGGREQ